MTTLEKTDITTCTVADIMQRSVTTVPPNMPLSEVARVLWDQQVSGVPVVTEDGRPIGLVSASDLVRVRAYGPRFRAPGGIPRMGDEATANLALLESCKEEARPQVAGAEPTAGDVMMPATFAVRAATTVPELACFLVRSRIHRALVLEHGRLVGLVTTFDIVKELARYAHTTAMEELPRQDDDDIEC
jgi:CBS domain-containing protein